MAPAAEVERLNEIVACLQAQFEDRDPLKIETLLRRADTNVMLPSEESLHLGKHLPLPHT